MEDTFLLFQKVYACAGITIFDRKNRSSKRWFFFQMFTFFLALCCFIFTSGFVVTNLSDLMHCIEGACIWTTGAIMFVTLGICLLFKGHFHGFLDEMGFQDGMMAMPLVQFVTRTEQKGKLKELNNQVVDSQEKLLKLTRIVLKMYLTGTLVCATMYLLETVYQMIVTDYKSLRLLAFDMWFPWSLQNLNVYVVSFIFHAYAGFLCCIAFPGFQVTIFLLVGQTIRQLRILTFILINLDELASELVGKEDERWQSVCTNILTQCVDHYVKIKRFTNKLNVICQPFYLCLLFVAMMLVCMCSVKIAVSDKLSLDTMKYYIHEFCMTCAVLMFCLLGQEVENGTSKLEMAVTEKWYIFDRHHKTNVKIFKMALSQRMPIYVFGSITLSLPTFTWFIKTGMSFFTLVMSVLEEQ